MDKNRLKNRPTDRLKDGQIDKERQKDRDIFLSSQMKLNNLKKEPRSMKMTIGNEKAMRKAYAEHGKAAGPEVRKFWNA